MIRIFIIEDHKVTIAGLRMFFRPSRDPVSIAKTSNTIEEALLIDDPDSFDVILLDLWLPTGDPAKNFLKLKAKFPGKPIVCYTGEDAFYWQSKMYSLGAKGFIHKTADKSFIENTLERVIKGETVYSLLMSGYQTKRTVQGYKSPEFGLTKEQQEIIKLFIDGSDAKDIAGKLGRNISSINKQLKKIRAKFEVSTNVNLLKKILSLDVP
jgi:DNA-binding NarL/FixJ family response regulator